MKKINLLYMKMLLFYSFLLLVIILILEGIFVFYIGLQNRETYLNSQQQLCQKTSAEVQKMLNHAQEFITSLYSDEMQISDVSNYLMYDSETYMENRLDSYSQSNYTAYNDKGHFINSALTGFDGIESIVLVSYPNCTMTQFFKQAEVLVKPFEGEALKENKRLKVQDGHLVIRKLISNTLTQEPLGEIQFSYGNQPLETAYHDNPWGEIQVSAGSGEIFFSTDAEKKRIEGDSSLQAVTIETGELVVTDYVKKRTAGKLSVNVWLIILLSGICLFILGEALVDWYLKRFEKRISVILYAMEQIKDGNLDVEIRWEERPDELDLIAENLDIMCKDLKRYIDKSYVAEIAQKKAEMEAMQNQINPHFLYNTLEAIRMNSIENGDRVSGKMLYNMAVIFRSQIKEKMIISLAKELYYGKKYMELYEFRHPGRFRFEMVCPEELLQKMTLKFSIQPIIENYFAHGIRAMDSDNFIKVEVLRESLNERMDYLRRFRESGSGADAWETEEETALAVVVTDNGSGMAEEAIEAKNKELTVDNGTNDSIGLMNIQRRVHAEFGGKYGLLLKHAENRGGLCVKLWIPEKEIE